jgi:hypothetical protein
VVGPNLLLLFFSPAGSLWITNVGSRDFRFSFIISGTVSDVIRHHLAFCGRFIVSLLPTWFGLWLCQPVGVWPSMISVLLCVCVCVCVYLWLCEYACVRACGRKTSSHSHLQSPLAPFWLWFYSISLLFFWYDIFVREREEGL